MKKIYKFIDLALLVFGLSFTLLSIMFTIFMIAYYLIGLN